MNPVAIILLFILGVSSMPQDDLKRESSHTVTLEETSCASTRRMLCYYNFVEASGEKEGKEKSNFNIRFYIGADQADGKEDAISRLDRFFRIKREASSTPGVVNTGRVGNKKAVRLQIKGSKYEFISEDGEKVVVDIEKKSRQ